MEKKDASEAGLTFKEEDVKFRDTLMSVIELSLIEALGKPGAKATFLRLEQDCELKKETIPEDLERFHTCIVKIFGSGALVIEKHIMKRLHASLFHGGSDIVSEKLSEEELDFTVFIQNLRTASADCEK